MSEDSTNYVLQLKSNESSTDMVKIWKIHIFSSDGIFPIMWNFVVKIGEFGRFWLNDVKFLNFMLEKYVI